jgi:hypothetical protein
MTKQAISPLRRRMIEDMSIRKFAAKTQHDGQGLRHLPWPPSRHGRGGGRAPLSTASEAETFATAGVRKPSHTELFWQRA